MQDNFKFGDDKEIVRGYLSCVVLPYSTIHLLQIVAMENNVVAVNKKALRRPTRASLASPSKNIRSRSSIVNAPF